jgi:hypothetical protein
MDEAIEYLDKGLTLAERMQELGENARPDFDDPAVAKQVMESLELARLLILTNNAYIKSCYAYFDYRAAPGTETRNGLATEVARLESAVKAFRAAPGFAYKLYGIDQLMENALAALDDLDAAEETLVSAPDPDGVSALILAHQEKDKELFATRAADAVKVLYWKGMVDGKDILRIRGDSIEIEHVAADPIHSVEFEFHSPLPNRPGTVFIRDMRSGEIHPFVLRQPTAENEFAAEVYLFDPGPGYAVWEMEIYFLDESPEAVGVDTEWNG